MKDDMRVASSADRLREAMDDAGMTQADLARTTGIHRSAISRYLLGEYEPKAQPVGKMAKALGVSEMWLWGYDVPKLRPVDQKNNYDLAMIVAKLRNDPDFYEVVSILAQLPPAEFDSIKHLAAVLKNK